jgi:type II secretory ATPase GspE/PulE/Tfp pilus assembly ATPase PilB-like protein
LTNINSPERKILTIEDPIEYQLKGITQMQIEPKVGFTFANALRSMLRHDPDVMMVGEIRDTETAELAVRTSLTGHLVFSTLHTNDAAGGVTRLLDMQIDAFLVSSLLCL